MHTFFIEHIEPFGNIYEFCQFHVADGETVDPDCLKMVEEYVDWYKKDSLTPEDLNMKFNECASYLQSKGHSIVLVEEKDAERFK